ncbi:MAG: HypC/HybG/HupF family hydrogenase formation chaperone [Acidimicrobiaceae bacterium]|nr:HypC/HybG/HupF family hydrogenase formation chaperone [Acidimicrobiaceae bacterium]MCY4281040.1 HypC/HybG/HupF family hydrogenase formation chaperone [Acidimicrobiaceae bacterium]MCY4294491.1 HypC/HybG/HupF family hydrogenase formation chaperone [Acidimicrobiaceae bacterium]
MGIPAQVVELQPAGPHTAVVDVDGAQREVNTVMVDDEPLSVGDWVLLHVGFAMARIDASEAAETLEFIRQLGSVYDEEMEAFTSSPDA